MNKQKGPNRIEWTEVFGEGNGFTSNPVGGCLHACRWHMPDGTTAICYAESVAEGVAQAAYPDGFAAHYWKPQQMAQWHKRKQPAGIFLDSMSDLMGHWVPDEQIQEVLDNAAACPQHVFFLLTKNAPRLLKFKFPANVWVGVSSPPDVFMGKELSPGQQRRMLDRALDILTDVQASVRWMSFEPLSWDVSQWVAYRDRALNWAVIGAASRGRDYFPPAEQHVRNLIDVLDYQGAPVYMKGNMRSLPWAVENWRQEYPQTEVQP